MTAEQVVEQLRRDFGVRELGPEDAQASPIAPTAGDAPCRYPAHRPSDWTGDGGKRICGVCHALPAPLAASSRPAAAAPVPTSFPAPCGAEAIRRALIDDAQDTRDATGPAREMVPGTVGLLYRGLAALLFSERGKGKTSMLLYLLLAAAAAGERVFYADRENGGGLIRERIDAILAANPEWGDPLADGRFVGRHWPSFDIGWDPAAYAEALSGFTVVAYDSLREVLSQLGLDPDRERDISRFVDLAVTPLVSRGVTVVICDNVGWADPDRPKGSGAKLDAIPTAYQVTTGEPFGPDRTGRIEARCTRSRLGDEGRAWTMRVGGGVFDPPTPFVDPVEQRRAASDADDRASFQVAAVQALEADGRLGREALIEAIRSRGVKVKATKGRAWLTEFVEDPTQPIIHDSKTGYSLSPNTPGPTLRDHPGPPLSEAPGPCAVDPPKGGHPSDRPGPSGPDRPWSSSPTPTPEVEGADAASTDLHQPPPAGEQEGPVRAGAPSAPGGTVVTGQGPTPHAASSPAASPSPETPRDRPIVEGFSLNVGADLVAAIAGAVADRIAGVDRPEPAPADGKLAVPVVEAAESLGMSVDHFRRHVLPDLRVVRSGRLRLVPITELAGWLDRHASRALGNDS